MTAAATTDPGTRAEVPPCPPGPGRLWWPPPSSSPSSWRVVTWAGGGPAGRDLTVAAGRVAVAPRMAGEAWLVGADGTWCRVTYGGDVAPSTGWAAAAARIINRSINIP